MPRKGGYVPKILRDMRAVWNQSRTEDKGSGQRRLREMLEKNQHSYLVLMQKQEAELKARREALKRTDLTSGINGVTDEGSDRIEELLKQILEAIKGK